MLSMSPLALQYLESVAVSVAAQGHAGMVREAMQSALPPQPSCPQLSYNVHE